MTKLSGNQRFKFKRTVLDAHEISRTIRRMAGQLIERHHQLDNVLLVGIRTRGLPLAERLREEIQQMEGVEVALGALDITLYRDDLSTIAPQPVIKGTHFPVALDNRIVVLTDDVLYTGRTVRAALDELTDYGRPKAVQLAVLIDRGHRELPIQADIIGKTLPTARSEMVEVAFKDIDGEDCVRLFERQPEDVVEAQDGGEE